MAFVAHAAIRLKNDESPKEKNSWHYIKQSNGIQYRWKLSKDNTYHLIAGVFDNPEMALKCAKQMYVSLFLAFAKAGFPMADAGCSLYETRIYDENEISIDGYHGDEKFFFWNKQFQGGQLGPGVFEVDNSLDEFDEYHFYSATISISRNSYLNFDDVDEYNFLYCREAQKYFNTIMLAENAYDYGMKMTIYCGLLEHLSDNKDKDADVISVLEQLILFVNESTISQDNKKSLINLLITGRKISSRKKCKELCERYAQPSYGGFASDKIIEEAYGIRSAFSHGGNSDVRFGSCSFYIKNVVLDVIRNYMREKEKIYD